MAAEGITFEKVTGKTVGNSPDQETRDTSLEFEITTLAADGSGFSGDNAHSLYFPRVCH